MGKRGKNAANSTVVGMKTRQEPPPPPERLGSDAAALWRECVEVNERLHDEALAPILEAYCNHFASARHLAAEINRLHAEGDLRSKRYSDLLAAHARETSAMESKATKLRLTNQQKMDTRAAARKAHQPSAGDARPWE